MTVDARACREYALECAIMALTAAAPQHRQMFTRLFQGWTNLALELERSDALAIVNGRTFKCASLSTAGQRLASRRADRGRAAACSQR
jgi:hypothetical protein